LQLLGIVQLDEQPSPSVLFPSSHSSPASRMPSPQDGQIQSPSVVHEKFLH